MGHWTTAWRGEAPPTAADIEAAFTREGLSPSRWSNAPGDRYGAHSHSYKKVLYCAKGSIVFTVEGSDVELRPGDRLEIEPGTSHSAVVGPEGVVCLEAKAA